MSDPSAAALRVARALQALGLARRVAAGLTLVGVVALVRLAPDRPTFRLAGVLLACVGAAVATLGVGVAATEPGRIL